MKQSEGWGALNFDTVVYLTLKYCNGNMYHFPLTPEVKEDGSSVKMYMYCMPVYSDFSRCPSS